MPDFELHYSVSGGYPLIEASLTLASNGQAEMFLGNSWSLPGEELDHAGWFGGPLPAEVMTDLSRMLAAPAAREKILRLQSAQAGKLPFDALVRMLRLVWDGIEFNLDLSASAGDAWISRLEELLRQAMLSLNSSPRLALRLQANLARENAALLPIFQVTSLGTQTAHVLLYDPSPPAQLCTASFNLEARIDFPGGSSAWNPKSMLQVPAGHWLSLMEQGRMPAQMALAAPQNMLQLPLPKLAQPTQEAELYFSGALTLWLSGVQYKRRKVALQTLRRPMVEIST